MKHIKTIFCGFILTIFILCLSTIIGILWQDDTTAEAETYKLTVYGFNVNSKTGVVSQSIEGSILTAVYEDGVYTLGEVGASSSARYNLEYYYKNGKYTRYYICDESGNQIPVYVNSNNYYYTTVVPVSAYFYNSYYSITYNLDGGTNSSSNPNYFEANSGTISLQAPTKDGYKFLGWYTDSSLTQYISSINKSTATSNVTLYAKWAQYVDMPVKYSTTDHYTAQTDIVGYVKSFYNNYVYYYEGLENVPNLVSGHSEYTVYSESNSAITVTYFDNDYFSSPSAGAPSYVVINSDKFYSVNYVLNGGYLDDGEQLYNYYYSRPDLATDPVTPKRDGYVFMGWFLDSGFTTTMYTSSFEPHDMTLYAEWALLRHITASFAHTDFYTASNDYVDTIDYYFDGYDYVYSSNINNLNTLHEGYSYQIRNTDDAIITPYAYEDKIKSLASAGTPSYIRYNTKEIYSITYELNGGYIDPEAPLYNYYNERADLLGNKNEPLKDDAVFAGWFLDAEFTTTVYTSSFVPHNMTLYAKWATKLYVPVYYYDSSKESPDYVNVGSTYYYIDDYNEYYLGYFPNTSRQIPYYFNKYDATSYKAYSIDDEELNVYSVDGNIYASATKELGYIRIYKHYSIRFYVNGVYMGDARGAESDAVEFPNYITGYIGENYDAGHIANLRIGKDYALYMFKGWSTTDTSDISWFYKEEVELVNEDITFMSICNDEYVISLYAYMTFYGKLNSINKSIDYDKYIESTNGIITLGSLYSLDDLMQEHVTEISSDSQKSNIDKILKYFKLDSIGSSALNILKRLFNSNAMSFSDLWNTLFGKIILIVAVLSIVSLAIINIFNFVKAASKIQSKT